MGHTHSADDAALDALDGRVRRILLGLIGLAAVVTVAMLAALWPGDGANTLAEEIGFDVDLIDAKVVEVVEQPCFGESGDVCQLVTVRIDEGRQAGTRTSFQHVAVDGGVRIDQGDELVLGHVADAEPGFEWFFSDFQRKRPLALLTMIFAVSVLLLGRWHGLRALAGLVISLGVLAAFVLPALLEGSDPMAVALAGSAAIAMVTLYFVHGFHDRTTVALLGTLASLALIAALAAAFSSAAGLTGLSSDDAALLQVSSAQIDLRGLLLAGFVIGALGVLDDVTVTQVSAAWELRRADPAMPSGELFAAGIRIGRDHIASTVNTLVLAYAGASLPLLLLFSQADRGLVDVAGSEVVAIEIIRALVGSVGLVAAVPITTALAVLVSPPTDPVGLEPGTDDAAEEPTASDQEPEAGPAAPADRGVTPEQDPPDPSPPRWEDFAPDDPRF